MKPNLTAQSTNKLIDEKDITKLSRFFKGKAGEKFLKFLMHLLAIDKVNWVYDHSFDYSGPEFTSRLLSDIGVDYKVGNPERLEKLPKGAFITIANHPYGGLDGIMLIDILARIRPDFKIMANKQLSLIKTLASNFISVLPKTDANKGYSPFNFQSIRDTLNLIRSGHAVGFFPSGAISDFKFRNLRVSDREWQDSIIRLIQKAQVPILPIRFFDRNSIFFYFLGLIDWRIRSLRLPHEIFNKQGQCQRIGVGEIITVGEQAKYPDSEMFGMFLRNMVYGMPLPSAFIQKSALCLPTK
ncbi:MAG: 1-acyl-sn-glycerol-3-phosphate acyltransferase [Bacteroidales bacterium]|jgi:putative hemolysin|nr:1-acyl-sn-glycerol-3-phosphate acyltransferase [Bacteroidales bacterium]HOA10471.1 1-acyl-sn-glycerol-3-phosphate acyltransferase [Tenuifilaceae bacterium]MBP8644028.1 1-acyl-sn-glycerol-3-phosphate acyltransferase [Bacteroidales bacterium]NLI87757.1 hypothetical protein [Bacteroidales bacterium]HOC37243.1 1-acyl-sn-glycerol-3-phosphate acyltransferase [Tenuifilaceae bacterium]